MTVVAKRKGTQCFSVFIKGAPEKVAGLCKPETSKNYCIVDNFRKNIVQPCTLANNQKLLGITINLSRSQIKLYSLFLTEF